MNIYLVNTQDYSAVVATQDGAAKEIPTPNGYMDGVDIYGDGAEDRLRDYFASHNINGWHDMPGTATDADPDAPEDDAVWTLVHTAEPIAVAHYLVHPADFLATA